MTPTEQFYREITLTRGKVTIVNADDYVGVSQFKWFALRCGRRFYAASWINRETILMHRYLLGLGRDDPRDVDHANHDTLDNRRSNLRPCTRSQNNGNRIIHKNNTSGFKGVAWSKTHKKYRVKLCGKTIGYFADAAEAARVYDVSAIARFGEFAHVNFPPETQKDQGPLQPSAPLPCI